MHLDRTLAGGAPASLTNGTGSKRTSHFSSLPVVATDEIFDLVRAFVTDPHADKVNLGVGVYRTEDGAPWPLDVVQKVEKQLHVLNDPARHEYLTIAGDPRFLELARDLAFGFQALGHSEWQEEQKSKIASVQTVSGTGANHMGALFLAHHLRPQRVWISDPTWNNHLTIWDLAGVPRRFYPYYRSSDHSFDFEGMIHTLEEQAQPNDVIVLHACAHNPTGLDPTQEQWKVIAEVCQRKHLFPFFDSAYQGFASGDPAEDAWAIRYFLRQKPTIEMCVAQSFSKNFGLYGQRTGALHLVTSDASGQTKASAVANLAHLIRGEFSMAPRYGSTVVKTILESEQLTREWFNDLQIMSQRIKSIRRELFDALGRRETPGSWNHIVRQIGMFSYTGLTTAQVQYLQEKYHIYMLVSGRISISGLTHKNVAYVAKAIDDAVRSVI
ncbi:MAG: hypothetical protein M1818_005464 [Claussenomyces sp. TS43310]|nr:MAG: hypothetical protein M1818_005464 [Claussenomyces sp. TS43310]